MNRQKQILVSAISLAIMLAGTFFMPLMKAYASDRETAVVVKLTLQGGKWIEARVIENGLLKIRDDKTGQTMGFSLEVIDRKTGTVRVKTIEFTDDKNNPSREVESFEVSFKSSKMTSVLSATNIEVLAIEERIVEKDS